MRWKNPDGAWVALQNSTTELQMEVDIFLLKEMPQDQDLQIQVFI
jgi:hypothetical protein